MRYENRHDDPVEKEVAPQEFLTAIDASAEPALVASQHGGRKLLIWSAT